MAVSTGSSAVLALILFVLDLSALEVFASAFRSSEIMTIAGGFVSSLLFFFFFIFLSNVFTVFSADWTSGWLEAAISVFVAMAAAATIHPVCITTCFLFSAGWLFYLNKVSKTVYKPKAI